jgi:hypothetical protein
VARCKRSFAVYCKRVHGITDRLILLETFNALRAKYGSDLDFHVAIIEAYRVYINKI